MHWRPWPKAAGSSDHGTDRSHTNAAEQSTLYARMRVRLQGKTKRSSSPSKVTSAERWAGKRSTQLTQSEGTSRVCARGSSIQPSGVSSRRNTAKAAPGEIASDFHSYKLAARLSVADSCGSTQRIQRERSPASLFSRYSAGDAPGLAVLIIAPYSRATDSVPSREP